MKDWCSTVANRPRPEEAAKVPVEKVLKSVAKSFVKLQQARHVADDDTSKTWSRQDVKQMIAIAKDAIAARPVLGSMTMPRTSCWTCWEVSGPGSSERA